MSELPSQNGGDALVDVLLELGIDTAFGVVSVHNLPLVDALERRLRFVPVRHEQAAVNAADGYGRVRRHLGVAVTSTGTGAGNAAGALIESLTAGSAVLHVTGQIDSPYLGAGRGFIHETRDQLGMLAAVSKAAWTIGRDDHGGDVLRAAAHQALAVPRGPVSIEWPIDLQHRVAPNGAGRVLPATAAPEATQERVDEAAELIRRARRPLVWAGGGAVGARGQVDRLLTAIGAGLLTSNAGRGTIPEDDERCIGNFAASDAGAELLGEADLLLSIGTHFRSNETRTYRLGLPAPHIQIDVDPDAVGRAYAVDVGLVGDAATVIDQLLEAVGGHVSTDAAWGQRVCAGRRKARADLATAIGPYRVICEAMADVLTPESVIARDVTIASSSWGNRLLPIHDPSTNVFARGGGIGQGLAMGIGASIARPEVPTVVIVGDGGLAAQLGELATLAQERPNCCVVVFNDAGYGVLRNMQDHHLGRRSGVDLSTPDFALLARSLDLPYERVTRASDFHEHFSKHVSNPGPSLVEVDVVSVGEMARPFIPPVEIADAEVPG